MITEAHLADWFTRHRLTPEQQQKCDVLAANIMSLARLIVARDTGLARAFDALGACVREMCPLGREQGIAGVYLADALSAARAGDVDSAVLYLRGAQMWLEASLSCAPSESASESPPTPVEPARRCCHPFCDAAATLAVHRSDDQTPDQAHSTDSCAAHLGDSLFGAVPGVHWLVYQIARPEPAAPSPKPAPTKPVVTWRPVSEEVIICFDEGTGVGYSTTCPLSLAKEIERAVERAYAAGLAAVPVAVAPTVPNTEVEPESQPRVVPVTRSRVDQMTPAELAIREAMLAVEAAGADERLTDAVNLLEEASAKVYAFALEREKEPAR